MADLKKMSFSKSPILNIFCENFMDWIWVGRIEKCSLNSATKGLMLIWRMSEIVLLFPLYFKSTQDVKKYAISDLTCKDLLVSIFLTKFIVPTTYSRT